MRDLHNFELFDNTEIEKFIQYFCIKLFIWYSIHIRNADIVLICVYIYYMYTVVCYFS